MKLSKLKRPEYLSSYALLATIALTGVPHAVAADTKQRVNNTVSGDCQSPKVNSQSSNTYIVSEDGVATEIIKKKAPQMKYCNPIDEGCEEAAKAKAKPVTSVTINGQCYSLMNSEDIHKAKEALLVKGI